MSTLHEDVLLTKITIYNNSWQAMRSLVNDRSVVKKNVEKDSCIEVWDCEDYIADAERQLGDAIVYKDVVFTEKNVARS